MVMNEPQITHCMHALNKQTITKSAERSAQHHVEHEFAFQ